jgi:hypothetical protein
LNKFPRKSTAAWAAIGIFVFVYDVIAMSLNDFNKDKGRKSKYETLSDGCWRGVEHPVVRWPIWLSVIVLAKHLAAPNFLRKYDPIGLVGIVVRYIRSISKNG